MYCIRISKLCKEDILSALNNLTGHFHRTAHRRLPEGEIEYMVQSERDQRTLDNTEDQRSEVACSCDKSSQSIDSVLYKRPYKIHYDTYTHISDRRYDRHKS